MTNTVIIIHENDEWNKIYGDALNNLGIKIINYRIDNDNCEFNFNNDLLINKNNYIFWNRMSPSSYTRGHQNAIKKTINFLNYLEKMNYKIISGIKATELEISKEKQFLLCANCNLLVAPWFVINKFQLLNNDWATIFNNFTIIIKPNCGGSGSGIKKFDSVHDLKKYCDNNDLPYSYDDKYIIQQYIKNDHLLRFEFIGKKLIYIVRVSLTDTNYNNCPSDSCNTGQACPIKNRFSNRFKILDSIETKKYDSIIEKLKKYIIDGEIDIAGIEIITDKNDKNMYIIDCNSVNTNYNSYAEKKANLSSGSECVAKWISDKFN